MLYRLASPFLFPLVFLPRFLLNNPRNRFSYPDALIEEAHRKELHKENYWYILLHYKNGFSGMKSLVDDPDFFLAPDGKRNPQAELDATIRAFSMNQGRRDKAPCVPLRSPLQLAEGTIWI